jgi:uncharacterized membrane protein
VTCDRSLVFSGIPVSSPIKLIHDITEILLKVALNTIATILTLLQIVTALFIYLFIHLFIVGFLLYVNLYIKCKF